MQYKQAESRVRPVDTEQIPGGRYLVRENIRKESRTDETGAAFDLWVYDEAVMTDVEYSAYMAVEKFEASREADIIDEYTLTLIEEGTL